MLHNLKPIKAATQILTYTLLPLKQRSKILEVITKVLEIMVLLLIIPTSKTLASGSAVTISKVHTII